MTAIFTINRVKNIARDCPICGKSKKTVRVRSFQQSEHIRGTPKRTYFVQCYVRHPILAGPPGRTVGKISNSTSFVSQCPCVGFTTLEDVMDRRFDAMMEVIQSLNRDI